jgi:hypothetical protein
MLKYLDVVPGTGLAHMLEQNVMDFAQIDLNWVDQLDLREAGVAGQASPPPGYGARSQITQLTFRVEVGDAF